MLYICELFLVYQLEAFKNCKEVKHIMILIIAIIYIFSPSVIFDEQLKNTSRKSSAPHKKIHSPLFTHSFPPKNPKSASPPPFLPRLKIFQVAPLQKGRWRTLCLAGLYSFKPGNLLHVNTEKGKEQPMIATQQPKLGLILIIKNILYITVSLR